MNRDEALRAKDLAEGLMKRNKFAAAHKLAMKAQSMDSSLDNISHMIGVCEVHCAASEKLIGNEIDWYAILQVEQDADGFFIKKQYKKLALLLHPNKNKFPGAESAFKLINEAQRILLDNYGKRKRNNGENSESESSDNEVVVVSSDSDSEHVPMPGSNNYGKRKRKNMVESSSESESNGRRKENLNFGKKKTKDSSGPSSSSAAKFTIHVMRTHMLSMIFLQSVAKFHTPMGRTTFKIYRWDMEKSWNVDCLRYDTQTFFTRGWKRLVDEYSITIGDTCHFR